MVMEEQDLRQELRRLARRATREGLLRGTFGNISVRHGDDLLISPTATDYLRLRPEDFVRVSIASGDAGSGRPSSELPLHLEIYRELPGVLAVWHDHSPFAVVAGLVSEDVPLFTGEGHGLIGLSLPVVPYLPSGSVALAKGAASVLRDRGASACLLRNHGAVATGRSLIEAYSCAWAVEEASMHALMTHGRDRAALPDAEALAIRSAFAAYRMR